MDYDEKKKLFDFFASESHHLRSFVERKMRRFNTMDAEDVVSEVMLKIFSRADTAGPFENLAGYVYRALRNKITDYERSAARTVSLQDYTDEDGETPLQALIADGTSNISSLAERKEFMHRLSQAISSLEPKQRAVFLATEMDGMSFKDLAKLWHEPIGTLLSRKSRAVKALRDMLKDFSPENI